MEQQYSKTEVLKDDFATFTYSYAKIAREHSIRVYEMPESPRDRLLSEGAANLSTAELLSLLIGTGNGHQGHSSLDIAHTLCAGFEEQGALFQGLRTTNPQALMEVAGLGPAKAAVILAAVELGRRVWLERPKKGIVIDNPYLAAQAFNADLALSPVEKFGVLHLDVRNRIIATEIIAVGGMSETTTDPRVVFRSALLRGTVKMILAHNHPSGDTTPSPEDVEMTDAFITAGRALHIPVLDHLVIVAHGFNSIRQLGLCQFDSD